MGCWGAGWPKSWDKSETRKENGRCFFCSLLQSQSWHRQGWLLYRLHRLQKWQVAWTGLGRHQTFWAARRYLDSVLGKLLPPPPFGRSSKTGFGLAYLSRLKFGAGYVGKLAKVPVNGGHSGRQRPCEQQKSGWLYMAGWPGGWQR